MKWGLVTGELERLGRQRGLGLIRVVRYFNELAVPGLGGLYFGKQLLWPLVGLSLYENWGQPGKAQGKGFTRTRLAEAVEGWACFTTWKNTQTLKWEADPRLRGRIKLRALEHESDVFRKLIKPGAYVRQPMRMKAVQPLYELGFVNADSARFSLYTCSTQGRDFLDAALGEKLHARVGEWAKAWKTGETRHEKAAHEPISPLTPLPLPARQLLLHRIVTGSTWQSHRRRNALAWVQQVREQTALEAGDTSPHEPDAWRRPHMLDEAHWHDIRAGAAFFRARDAAVGLLALLEGRIASSKVGRLDLDEPIPQEVHAALDELARSANTAHDLLVELTACAEDARPLQTDLIDVAQAFHADCLTGTPQERLRRLVQRDGRTLRLADNVIEPGPAFKPRDGAVRQTAPNDDADRENVAAVLGPRWFPDLPGLSARLPNLYMLACDLDGKLDGALYPAQDDQPTLAAI